MKILQDPSCPHCPGTPETQIQGLWKCPKTAQVWVFINTVMEETCLTPIFIKEAMLGVYEENTTSCSNLVIVYRPGEKRGRDT